MRKIYSLMWVVTSLLARLAAAQTSVPLTWEQVRQRFQDNNPTLLAGKLNVDESKAQEITAYLRPNPSFSLLQDQINPFGGCSSCGTFSNLLSVATASYLFE